MVIEKKKRKLGGRKKGLSKKDAVRNDNVNVKVSVVWESEFKPRTPAEKKADKKRRAKSKGKHSGSASVRKAPRAARSANARRWKDLRESDGLISEVITYTKDAEGNLIEKK